MKARIFGTVFGVILGWATVLGASPAVAAEVGCAEATPAALAEFLDKATPQLLQRDRIPGAAVSVVSGGSTAFAKGYGVADVEHGTPFDASRSLVRIASITKLFTWTAVMQQVEAGRLDLNTDVNQYLNGLRIPAAFDRPITLQHLMDHTAGFEDYIIGTAARSAEDVVPLGEYLAAHIPVRVRPPGEISAYSNYGAALAGHIVAEVSGEPYDAYVRRHLFEPLGMSRSTAAQPIPDGLAGDLARSYRTDTDPPRAIPFMFDNLAPDGSISTTAADMARFMNAHLRPGTVLSAAATARMHQRSFAADPRLDGYAHGFKERTVNGHRMLTHDGGWEGFRSMLMLVPGCDLGIFIALNGTDVGPGAAEFIDAFFDRFTPAGNPPEDRAAAANVTAARAGFYQSTRHNETGVEKVASLLGPSRLTVAEDGTVKFNGKEWKPQRAGLYQAAGSGDRLVFLHGSRGRLYAVTDGTAYELMGRGEELPFNLLVLLGFALPALGTLVLVRRRSRVSTEWRRARVLACGAALLGLAFLGLLLATLIGNTDEFYFGAPLSFNLMLGIPFAILGAALASTALTVKAWRGSSASAVARTHQMAVLCGLAALAWFIWQWNLIGWQYT